MQDARVRLGCAALLSVAAFFTIACAVAVFFWWLIFTPRMRSVRNRKVVLVMLTLIGIIAVMITISGGDGFSYLMRMGVIVLIGTWLYAEQGPGDFLSVAVWGFGKRWGFELGMIGECAMQIAESLSCDFTRIQTAMKLKGRSSGIKNLVPTGLILIHDALVRADEITELLAVRGYKSGGTLCPVFRTTTKDYFAGICAICVLIFTTIPVSEFFILHG
jgi:hypothetical protein